MALGSRSLDLGAHEVAAFQARNHKSLRLGEVFRTGVGQYSCRDQRTEEFVGEGGVQCYLREICPRLLGGLVEGRPDARAVEDRREVVEAVH